MTSFSLFPNNTLAPAVSLSAGCTTALTASLSCDPYILTLATVDYYGSLGDDSLQSTICSSTCTSSFASYRSSVVNACANDPQPWPGVPATFYGDWAWSSYNLTCLRDSQTGQWCNDYIANITSTLTDDTSLSSLPTDQLCSQCTLSLMQHLQSTPFSNYNDDLATEWASAQQKCQVSFPTAVQPPAGTVTPPGYTNLTSSGGPCLSGKNYTVVSGDNCETIAESQGVALGSLRVLNNLLPDCSDLQGGAVLCLPEKCQTYKINSGDTCGSISLANGISIQALLAYNPTISSDCSNLIADTTICIGLPGTTYNGTTIGGAIPTPTGTYATATVAPPGNVAFGTTKSCGGYYQVKSGDICQIVAINNTISIDLFEDINPSIDSACSNLVPGLWYCVFPTLNWNQTSSGTVSSSVIPAPAPTTSGTTSNCFQWYIIQSGDTCSLIEDSFGITDAQFRQWNPSIDSNCFNILVDDAYCVHGADGSTPSPARVAAALFATVTV